MNRPINKLLSRLEQVEKTSRGWRALCPAHEDRNPSLSIAEGDNGTVLLRCWAGCEVVEIVHAIDLQLSDLFVNEKTGRNFNQQTIRPNWHEIVQLIFHDATVIMIAASKMERGAILSDAEKGDLRSSYHSLQSTINTTKAFGIPKRGGK